MATFIATLLLTFGLVSIVLILFWRLGTPFYRVEKVNVERLLELVLSGEATDSDWQVFAGYPIRQDPQLFDIQKRCLEIAESEYVGGEGFLFTPRGLDELRDILEELKSSERKSSGN